MANTDIFPPDYETPVGKVRVLIGDTEQRTDPAAPDAGKAYLFSDAELAGLVSIDGGNHYYAAAHALEVLATNEALVSKKIRTEAGLQTDGPAVANALGETAKRLRADGTRLANELDSTQGFEIVNFSPTPTLGFPGWGY